jgi:hypothetical protein
VLETPGQLFPHRRLWLLVVIVLAAMLFAAVYSFKAAGKMPDFEVYWRAGVRARAAEPLYRTEDQHYVLKYLPAFAVLAVPAGLLPLQTAKAVWFTLSAALLIGLLGLSLTILPERRRPAWLLVSATFIAMAKFYGHEMVLGQVNLLLAAMTCAAIALLRARREAAAGVLIAFAVVIKPYAVIFAPWLLARRRVASILALAVGLVAVLVLPVPLYGFSGNAALLRDWWRTVTASTAPNLLGPDNVSLAAMYAKWLGPGSAAAFWAAATSAALLVLVVVLFARRGGVRFPEALEGALLLTLMPLLSPQGWDYVFLVSTPAVMLLVDYADRLPRPLAILTACALVVIAFSIYDVMGRASYAAFMALSAITVCYLVVIAALAALRLRRVA